MHRTLRVDLNKLTEKELESYLVLRQAERKIKIKDDNKGWLNKVVR